MLTRSKRPDIHSNTTTADLGPGAYDTLPALGQAPRHAVAPFGSTSTRSAVGASALDTMPGPGAYFSDTVQAKSVKPSSVFASRQERIPMQKSSYESQNLPGPGAYTGDIIQQPKRSAMRPRSGTNMHSAEGINWVKVATAPSIPNVKQSYGYEEGPAGALVLQSAPYKGHTGVGKDTAGPGEYQPTDALVRHVRTGTNFGAASGRGDITAKDAASRPGPGTYDFAACGTSDAFKGGVTAQRQSSSFASTSKRNTMPTGSYGPGPGAYRAPTNFAPLAEHLAAHPESFSAFGRTVVDDSRHGVTEFQPGPGDYEPSKNVTARNSVATKPLSVMASKTTRFSATAPPRDTVPGPGSYAVTDDTMVAKLGKHINGRFGAFGSTSSRFEAPKASAASTGPGSYNAPAALPNPAEARRRDQRSSCFRSSTRRADLAAPTTSATAFYNPQIEWTKPTSTSQAFISNQPRFVSSSRVEVPGPGQYEPRLPQKVSACVGADVSRASRWQGARIDDMPGPGSYNTQPSMVKRTFNISIGS